MSVIDIYCTDKERHRKLTIVRLQKVSSGQWCEVTADRGGAPGEFLARSVASRAENGIYRLQCRRCGRDTRVNIATLTRLLDGIAAADRSYLDLSHLPF